MRFLGLIMALWAAIAFAQTQPNYINVPAGGFDVQAGQPFTITWQNPSQGDVTIRLTQGDVVQNDDGVALGTFPASAGTATFTIPNNVNTAAYNFAIQSVSDPNVINFSSTFTIGGATASPSSSGTITASSSSATMTSQSSTATDATSTGSSSSSGSSQSASSTSSRSSSASSRASSASATASTGAPSSNNAGLVKAGGMIAIMAGAIAVF